MSVKIPIPGRLMYRGYDVADLVHDTEKRDEFGYEQAAYLLLFGALPTRKQLETFTEYLGSRRVLPHLQRDDGRPWKGRMFRPEQNHTAL